MMPMSNQFAEGTRGDEVDLSQAYQAVWRVVGAFKKGVGTVGTRKCGGKRG